MSPLTYLSVSSLSAAHMCSTLEHNCAHFCINIPGSYVCRCKQGYILNSDQTTCRSKTALLIYLWFLPLPSSSLFFYLGSFYSSVMPHPPQLSSLGDRNKVWYFLVTPSQCLVQSWAHSRPSGRVRKLGRSTISEISSLNVRTGLLYIQAYSLAGTTEEPFHPLSLLTVP